MRGFNPLKPNGNSFLNHDNKINENSNNHNNGNHTKMLSISNNEISPSEYLPSIIPHISDEIISQQNFSEIKRLAEQFDGNITSFFGFESNLASTAGRSDYLIAVSSQKGERQALSHIINKGGLPEKFIQRQEWQNIGALTKEWNNPHSILYHNILGVWLEFDTSQSHNDVPVPSVFLHTIPLHINNSEDVESCKWVTQTAIPLLTGKKVSKKIEQKFFEALNKLPPKASVFHVASMLSRSNTEGMRLVIKRITPCDIVPYLKSLGWKDKDNKLQSLIEEIKKYSNCIRLHINISDHVDQKIGLECFISPDKYHHGQGWNEFFDQLIEEDICLPAMKNALLSFPGVNLENPDNKFSFETYQPSVKFSDNTFSKALIRYISHIKISYNPGNKTKAKAYTGVRLFGLKQ